MVVSVWYDYARRVRTSHDSRAWSLYAGKTGMPVSVTMTGPLLGSGTPSSMSSWLRKAPALLSSDASGSGSGVSGTLKDRNCPTRPRVTHWSGYAAQREDKTQQMHTVWKGFATGEYSSQTIGNINTSLYALQCADLCH